jgi:hypothetical protein
MASGAVLQDYTQSHPLIDLRIVDLDGDYYTGALQRALDNSNGGAQVDVAEVDTIFLQDLVDAQLIAELPKSELETNGTYVPLAANAVVLNDKV